MRLCVDVKKLDILKNPQNISSDFLLIYSEKSTNIEKKKEKEGDPCGTEFKLAFGCPAHEFLFQ